MRDRECCIVCKEMVLFYYNIGNSDLTHIYVYIS